MALFTESRLRQRVQNQIAKGGVPFKTPEAKARGILAESLNEQRTHLGKAKIYDIFLSHSSSDAALVAGLKLELEDLNFSVYVDWIEDPMLNRAEVNRETALVLQARMKQSKSLLYAFSENASNSKWMPWELGYFDGIKGKVAVLPIVATSKGEFQGSEYLGIYYYIQIATINGTNNRALWVYDKANKYIIFKDWLNGGQPIQR